MTTRRIVPAEATLVEIEAAHNAMFAEPFNGQTAAMVGAGIDADRAALGLEREE